MRRRIYFGWLCLHLLLLCSVCASELVTLIAEGHTSLPSFVSRDVAFGAKLFSKFSIDRISPANVVERSAKFYEHCAGIELGYGFFAPRVPNTCKLVFEIHHQDGHVDYDLPHVGGDAGGSHVTTLIDEIGRLEYAPLRETLLKILASPIWQENPDAVRIRAVLGFINAPTIADVRAGKAETYQFLYAYDFSLDRQFSDGNTRDEPPHP